MYFKNIILSATILLVLQGNAFAESFNAGVQAYQRAEYEKALTIWKTHAEQGNKVAQMLIGSMYAYGEGVERNDKEAVKWFTLSAKNGYARAQFNLGVMYENGWGVEKNIDTALYWFKQAASQGRDDAKQKLNKHIKENNTASADKPLETANGEVVKPESSDKGPQAIKPVQIANKLPPASTTEKTSDNVADATTTDKHITSSTTLPTSRENAGNTNPAPVIEKNNTERIALLIDTRPSEKKHSAKPATARLDNTAEPDQQTGWLYQQQTDHYTIQLASHRDRQVLEDFIKDITISETYQIVSTKRSNRVTYSLVYGAYADINAAQQAIELLPPAWKKYVPWIREIRTVVQQ